MPESRAIRSLSTLLAFGLVAGLLTVALRSWLTIRGLADVPWGCDAFGHYRIAEEFRAAAAEHRWPDFHFRGAQVDRLVAWFKNYGWPPVLWQNAVAPHAHHFVWRNQTVVDQYTPGTGLMLGIFPEGQALPGLNFVTLLISLLVGGIGLALSYRKRSWAGMAFVAAATYYNLDLVANLNVANYSAPAIILPTLLAAVFCFAAISLGGKSRRGSLAAAFLTGACAGFCVLVRVPCFLGVPGWFFLLPTRGLRKAYAAGVAIFGFLPLAIYQAQVTGAWWATTYSSVDTEAPSIKVLGHYLVFYLIKGPGARFFLWAFLVGVCFWIYGRRENLKQPARIVFGTWGLSALFFCTHVPAVHYYLVPAHLNLVWMAAAVVLRNEWKAEQARPFPGWALAPLFAGLALALAQPWPKAEVFSIPFTEFGAEKIPAELLDPGAWVWSDLLSGAFYAQARKDAFRIASGPSAAVDAALFADLHQAGDRQFLVEDGGDFAVISKIYRDMGVTLEPRGKVFTMPYYLAKWPGE